MPGICDRSCAHSLWLSRAASSSSKKAAGSRGGKSGGPGGAAKAKEPAVRTPEWAHLPELLTDLDDAMRKQRRKLAKLAEQQQGKDEDGFAAAAESLPVPPADGGAAALAAALAPATPFDAAAAALTDLARRGVTLDPDAHLGPLLRKAQSAADVDAWLGVLRAAHLAQAAWSLGSHGPRHTGLHAALVEECVRLGSPAPLVALWDSPHEHGVEPGRDDALAAVRAAVRLRDGGSAAALLAISALYGEGALAGEAAGEVAALLQEVAPDQAAKLKELLPKLGM